MTRAEFPAKFHAGAVFERPDGALLRVDIVDDEQIYFVSWRPGQETGCPIRMGLALFVEAWEREWEPGVPRPADGIGRDAGSG